MKIFYSKLSLMLSVCLTLIGCSPIYKTFYSYSTPEGRRGRECVIECKKMEHKCRSLVNNAYQQCLNRKTAMDITNAQIQSTEKVLNKTGVSGYGSGAYSYENCDHAKVIQEEQCITDYNSCYELCGGQVYSETKCVANCK